MMTVLMIMIQTLSLYALYNTSKRAELRKDRFSTWLQRPSRVMVITAWVLLAISFVAVINVSGLGAGIFIAFLSLMTTTSLIIILSPLRSGGK